MKSNFPESADIETASDDYATRFSGPVGQFFLNEQLKGVLSLLEGCHEPAILDVGGGHGQLAIPLVKRGYAVTVTGSADSCELRLKRELPPGSYRYATCNMLELPYPDNSFDIAMAFRIIPHAERWRELIGELSRVARTSVIVDYPDIRSANILNALFFKVKKSLEGNTRPFGIFSRKMIAEEFIKHGYYVERFIPEFFLPMVLHRKIGSAAFSGKSEKLFSKTGLTGILGSPIIVHLRKRDELR